MRKIKEKTGYIGMEKLKEIIRLYENKISNKQIGKILKISRTSVVQYVNKIKTNNINYEKIKDLPENELVEIVGIRKSGKKTSGYKMDYEYFSRELLKPSVTKLLLWKEELEKNPDFFGYSQFCQNLKQYEKSQKISMHQNYSAGYLTQMDYAGDKIKIYDRLTNEVKFEASIFVGCLPASKYCFVYATPEQTSRSWILAINKMFDFFGGVTECLVSDNATSVISDSNFFEPTIQRTLLHMAQHYGFVILNTRTYKPRDKGIVENTVGNIQRRLAGLRNIKFYSLEDVQIALRKINIDFCNEVMKAYGKSRLELFNEIEKETLKPLPLYPYKLTVFNTCRVQFNYHVLVEKNYYSVPFTYRGSVVESRVCNGTVEIWLKGLKIATHLLEVRKTNAYITKQEHMPVSHKFMSDWTPQKFVDWGTKIGVNTKIQIEKILESKKHPEQAYRSCLGVLNLSNNNDTDKLEQACKLANKHNCIGYKKIKLLLANLKYYSELKTDQDLSMQDLTHDNLRDPIIYH